MVFFLTSLGLAYVATHKPKTGASVMQGVTVPPAPAVAPAGEVPKPAGAPAGPNANDVPK